MTSTSDGTSRLPWRTRWATLLVLLLASPVFAEYSSSYLDSTGNPVKMAGELVMFVPLYGFIAVLLREVAVRRGMGWTGLFLLAGGYGLVMASVVDRSIFTLTGTAEPYWPSIVGPTWVDPVGLSVGAAVGWALGHALTTIAAAVAVTGLLVPASSGQPLLGRPGIVVCLVGWALAAVAVHTWAAARYEPAPTLGQYALVLGVACVPIGLAFSPFGRPVRGSDGVARGWWGLVVPAVLGGAVLFAADVAAMSWAATGLCAAAVAVAGVAGRSLTRRPGWTALGPVAAMLGAMLVRALEAFQTPAAAGVSEGAKLAHVVTFLVVILLLCALTVRRWLTATREQKASARSG